MIGNPLDAVETEAPGGRVLVRLIMQRRGDVVGTVGDSGSLKGAYLYFELREGQTPLDPELWLSRPRRRAPPVAGPQASAPVTRGP